MIQSRDVGGYPQWGAGGGKSVSSPFTVPTESTQQKENVPNLIGRQL